MDSAPNVGGTNQNQKKRSWLDIHRENALWSIDFNENDNTVAPIVYDPYDMSRGLDYVLKKKARSAKHR